jgi:ribosome maturation factor RimP
LANRFPGPGGARLCLPPPGQSAEIGKSRGEVQASLVDTNRIATAIEPSLETMGYRLVRVVVTGGRRATLQIMAERRDDRPMTVDDCAQISNSVSALLDVSDPIPGAYTLEVSSPGVDRPLVRREDYDRFSGFEAKIELARPIDGRKRFRGRLLGTAGETVRLATEVGETELPLEAVARAKLVLTEDLIAAARPQSRPSRSPTRSRTA